MGSACSNEGYQMRDPLATVEYLLDLKENKKAKVVLDLLKEYAQEPADINRIALLYLQVKDHKTLLELANKLMSFAQNKDEELDIKTNMIRSLLATNEPDKALEHILDIEKYRPEDASNQLDKSLMLFLLNRREEAEAILHNILSKPRSKDIDNRANFNLGTYDMGKGNFKEGMHRILVGGRKLKIWEEYDIKNQEWKGETIPGKTILIAAEAGMGDEIIDIRFYDYIKERGMIPVWYTNRKDLADIFNRHGYNTITNLKLVQPDWLWVTSMMTPIMLDLDYKDLWRGPYLTPKREKEILPGKFKVGIKCRGNPEYDHDLHRSIPEKQFLECFPKDWTIYSFHVDEDLEDERVISLRDKIKTWDDTLDYIDQMDLIVSSCTSLPHAASAMGKETVVIVPLLNYYIWAYLNKHSPWYGKSTTILRQKDHSNWNAPLEELKVMLEEKCKKS